MEEEITYKGEWFLPSNQENRLHGSLSIISAKVPILSLYGSFEKSILFPDYKNQEIILGITKNSEQVTLYKCTMAYSGDCTIVFGEDSGKPTTKYYIEYALIGVHALRVEDIKFNVISSQIFNLDEWIKISGFEITHQSINFNGEISINYKKPESISFDIDKKAKGQFNFKHNYPTLTRYQKNITISQHVEYCVSLQEDLDLVDLLQYIYQFQSFLTLAIYRKTYPISLTLKGTKYFKDYNHSGRNYKSIKLFSSLTNSVSSDIPSEDYEMIFTYESINNDFQNIIKSWYSKYEIFKPAFELVIEQFNKGTLFSVNTFLNLAQSAETFHARINNHTRIPKEQYKRMKKDILEATPSEYHKWLNDQFNFGNELNLHTRLTEIINKYSNTALDIIIKDKNQFVLDVKHSRNYYTHYNTKVSKNAIKDGDLFYLSERLKILLICSFLIELGFDQDNLAKQIDKIKWLLFNHLLDE